jgi:hypothetical protein
MYFNVVNLITNVFFGVQIFGVFFSPPKMKQISVLQWALPPQDMSMKDLILCLLEADNRKVFLVQD